MLNHYGYNEQVSLTLTKTSMGQQLITSRTRLGEVLHRLTDEDASSRGPNQATPTIGAALSHIKWAPAGISQLLTVLLLTSVPLKSSVASFALQWDPGEPRRVSSGKQSTSHPMNGGRPEQMWVTIISR